MIVSKGVCPYRRAPDKTAGGIAVMPVVTWASAHPQAAAEVPRIVRMTILTVRTRPSAMSVSWLQQQDQLQPRKFTGETTRIYQHCVGLSAQEEAHLLERFGGDYSGILNAH